MDFLTPEDSERAVREIVESSGPNGIEEADLKKAFTAIEDLAYSVALWRLWQDRKIIFGWDTTADELKLKAS